MKTMAETLANLEQGLQQCIAEENAAHDKRMRQEGAILILRQLIANEASRPPGADEQMEQMEASNG